MTSKDATIVLFDVGANTKECDESSSLSFYEQAKKCVDSIIMRKILTKPKDEVALYLIGTKYTDNDLHTTHGGYENINRALPMQPVSWDTLNYVRNSIDPPSDDTTADWLDSLVVAMDYFTQLDLKKTTKKIILFTTFSTIVNGDNIGEVINGLKQLEIELIVITKNVVNELDVNSEDQLEFASFSQTTSKSQQQADSEKLILQIVSKTDGCLCGLDEALTKLIYVDKKHRRRMPWNSELSIGSLLNIKVSAYIYVRDDKELPPWETRCASGEKCKSKIDHFYNDEMIPDDVVKDELIKGYLYGGVPVPDVQDSDENVKKSEKGLFCIGFTSAKYVRDEYLVGETMYVVVPQKGTQVAPRQFSALLKAMHGLDFVIIARYVYRTGTAPKLMALFPSENSMQMMELFFKDNHVSVRFPPLDSQATEPSEDQLNFMDKFIDANDLTKVKAGPTQKPTEKFKKLLDPGLQYMYRAIAHRALNPSDPLLKPDEDVMALITPPQKIDPAMLEEMKNMFPLKPAKVTNREKFMANLQNVDTDKPNENGNANVKVHSSESDVIEIGTVKPADDFMELLDRGEPFNMLATQIQNVIMNLMVKSMVAMDEKIHKALLVYRETAKQKAPFQYNTFIEKFKVDLHDRNKTELWDLIVKEGLGLITRHEGEMSTVSDEEANEFYKSDEIAAQTMKDVEMDASNDDFDDV